MHEQLINLISQSVTIADKDKVLCKQFFEPVLFPKNRIVEEEGSIPKHLYFVVSNYQRKFGYINTTKYSVQRF